MTKLTSSKKLWDLGLLVKKIGQGIGPSNQIIRYRNDLKVWSQSFEQMVQWGVGVVAPPGF